MLGVLAVSVAGVFSSNTYYDPSYPTNWETHPGGHGVVIAASPPSPRSPCSSPDWPWLRPFLVRVSSGSLRQLPLHPWCWSASSQ